MITFQVESVQDIQNVLSTLISDHYSEVESFADKIPLSVDWDKYYQLEDLGMLHIVTARESGELVGYFMAIIAPNLHASQDLVAMNHTLYLKPDLRRSGLGEQMIRFAESCYKELGVSVVTIHMKEKYPFDSLCKKLGYELTERTYMKYVGDN